MVMVANVCLNLSDSGSQQDSKRKCGKESISDDEEAYIKAKHAHSRVERRYRDNLNQKFIQLQRTLATAKTVSRLTKTSIETSFILPNSSHKMRKSAIDTKAINDVTGPSLKYDTNPMRLNA
jgi:hypothetical protein